MTATGTCPRCRVQWPLDATGHISVHLPSGIVGVPVNPCSGSARHPLEFTATARATRDRRLAAQVAAARDQAGVTLDAWLAKHGGSAHGESIDKALLEVPKLLKLAAKLGALTHPPERATTNGLRRATKWWAMPWFAVNRRQIHMQSGRTRNGPDVDVYCVFCGEMILSAVDRGVTAFLRGLTKTTGEKRVELNDKVYLHTTPCALACLAGLRTPVAPGTKRLPSDVRQEEQA